MLRVAIALIAAPALVWATLFALALALHPDPADSGLLLIGPLIGAWLVVIAVMVGLPLVIVLRRYERASLWPYALVGALTGLAMLLLIAGGLRDVAADARRNLLTPLGFVITGAAIGAAFWWLGVRRNPWFVSGEHRLEAIAVRAAAAANANAQQAGRTVGRMLSATRQAFAPVVDRGRAWRARPRKPPVLTVSSLLIPAGIVLAWTALEHADLRPLGYAAMLVYVLMIAFVRGGVIAGICLALAALVRRERFWPLALAGLLANIAVALRFSST